MSDAALLDQVKAAVEAGATSAPASSGLTYTPGRVLHIDGDYMAYFCAGNDDTSPSIARKTLTSRVQEMQRAVGADSVMIHLTADWSDKGKRFAIATVKPYQGQRSGSRKPANWQVLREYMMDKPFPITLWADREADDGFALAGRRASILDGDLVAYSTRDKDMRMLPGIHLDWMDWTVTYVQPGDFDVIGPNGLQYGHKWFWLQMLQGDTADNIPGLERYIDGNGKVKPMGEKTAAAALGLATNNVEAGNAVAVLYKNFYQASWADRICEQAALLWLREDTDGDISDFMCMFKGIDPELYAEIVQGNYRMNERVSAAS